MSLFDDSAVDGNVAFHLGDGTNIYDLNHAFTVNGVFGLTSGTGTDDVGTIAGVIAGNQTYSLGGGANTLVWAGTTLAERFTYTGGGGVDRLTVAGVNAFRLIVDLGAGDDFFAYGAAATVEAAELDFAAGNDIYDPSLTTVVWNTTLLNL